MLTVVLLITVCLDFASRASPLGAVKQVSITGNIALVAMNDNAIPSSISGDIYLHQSEQTVLGCPQQTLYSLNPADHAAEAHSDQGGTLVYQALPAIG